MTNHEAAARLGFKPFSALELRDPLRLASGAACFDERESRTGRRSSGMPTGIAESCIESGVAFGFALSNALHPNSFSNTSAS